MDDTPFEGSDEENDPELLLSAVILDWGSMARSDSPSKVACLHDLCRA